MPHSEPVSYILLAHNEASTIERELRAIDAAVIRRLPGSELIVAEDGSSDGTRGVIEALRDELRLRLVVGTERKGYARALIEAAAVASHSLVMLSDGGAKHDPEDFWKLYAMRGDHDVVIGRKTGRRDQRYRRALTAGLNLFLRLYFGAPLRDADSGYRLYSREVVNHIVRGSLLFRGFVSAEIALRALAHGFRVAEAPVSYRLREGESRGLPPRTIARAVIRLLSDARALKREIRKGRRARDKPPRR